MCIDVYCQIIGQDDVLSGNWLKILKISHENYSILQSQTRNIKQLH